MPEIEHGHIETLGPGPGGHKGVGEGGAIGAPSAVVNAVADALAPLGVTITRLPLTPAAIVDLLTRRVRIGLTVWAVTPDKLVEQVQRAEADGFSSIWYASGALGDPLVAMAMAGRATSTIELGTAVQQTYPCHPLLQAQRAASVASAMGRPGFTLGVGPSHDAVIEGTYGLSFDHPGRSTEEYVQILTTLLRGEGARVRG